MFSMSSIPLFIFLYLVTTHSLAAQNCLEEASQDFILEIRQIHIPDHPHAFNPSIIRWKGNLLMSFREIIENEDVVLQQIDCSAESRIGLVFLDDDFNPSSEVQILDLNGQGSYGRADDARLVTVGEKLYLVYSDNLDVDVTNGGYRVYVALLEFDGKDFAIGFQERMSHFEGERSSRREKNWVPFDYVGNLLLAYSLSPHRILSPLLGLETCVTIAKTSSDISWSWGELRGGTPGILVDGEYLSIFHSSLYMKTIYSNGKSVLHYFIGAYTFAGSPPFAITKMSPEPMIAKGFYSGEIYTPYWKPVHVVFPCGLMAEGSFIWMAYGRQDHEIWIAKIDKQGLLGSLVPINK